MAKLTQDMKDIWAKAQDYILATIDREGKPNSAPVGLARIVSQDQIMLVDHLMVKTRENIEQNPNVAITFWSDKEQYGYQLKGKARMETAGKLFDNSVKWIKDKGFPSNPKAIIVVRVEEAYYVGKGKDSSKNLL
ncbi:MAG TPA: flavin-nucleotide-binding protein [Dehalococcoidia bacterium]|nr:flavin-nucleotide-binding protein [Dehalococcoidia bacterium]